MKKIITIRNILLYPTAPLPILTGKLPLAIIFLLHWRKCVSLALKIMNPSTTSVIDDFNLWSGIDWVQSACLGMIFIDMETISIVPENLLTPREAARAMRMGPRRRRDFTAARVALKRLARRLDLVRENTPDRKVETLDPDDVRPCIDDGEIYCSVSHSAGLVVAAAHRHPIGVDLELASEKVQRIWSHFQTPREADIVVQSGLSPARIAARAWTIKEAAAKALDLRLFQAIREVEVVRVGEKEGMIRYKERLYPVRHAEGNGYVISLITCDDQRKN
jgi:phosphopantetheinyl transferase